MDEKDHWFISHWRPAMGWLYGVICAFDFILAPIMMVMFAKVTGTPLVMWKPLTLEGGGLVHLSFASIVTMTAWTRGTEKLKALEVAATTVK
jgi:hypothetical protein